MSRGGGETVYGVDGLLVVRDAVCLETLSRHLCLLLPIFHVFLGPKGEELGPCLGWCRTIYPFLAVKGEDARVEDELVGGGNGLKGCVVSFSR